MRRAIQTTGRWLTAAVVGLVVAAAALPASAAQGPPPSGPRALEHNAHYIAPPAAGQSWPEWLEAMRAYRRRARADLGGGAALDDAIYRRDDLRWMRGNFVCGFLFLYDREFWDPHKRQYRVAGLCDDARREFGGFDSVVLWHAYPRIGADARNQFDFFRHMPGGLEGLRGAVREFHGRGVRVFIPYMPWDTGTRREKVPDDKAVAQIVAAIEADGVFLDTMRQAPAGLRRALDAVRPGVALEPEGHPSVAEMQVCSGSWAQGLRPFSGIGVLRLKWIEPRHVQHQVRRWDTSHQGELAAAWISGSGVLVWENIFGSWNPWNAEDRKALRRMAPVLRHFAELLAEGEWLPCYPTLAPKVVASCWQGKEVRLWTLVNQGEGPVDKSPVLEVEPRGERFFDLWRGVPLVPQKAGAKLRLRVPVGRFGAVAAVRAEWTPPGLFRLLRQQQSEAARTIPKPGADPHVAAAPVLRPEPPPACAAPTAAVTAGMLRVDGGKQTFVARHMRRECGCYPDPGTPPARWQQFLKGNPHSETMEHRVTKTLGAYWIDPRPVTNGQFEEFIKAARYKPACADRFLEHWGGAACPAELRGKPVVYVDLDDARAYAAWAGKRLPTEWEWQEGARRYGTAGVLRPDTKTPSPPAPLPKGEGRRFRHDEVHEWTESRRDDGHTRFVLLRGGCAVKAEGSIWYFPGGPQPVESHAKFLLHSPGLDRCGTIGFRCVAPETATAR